MTDAELVKLLRRDWGEDVPVARLIDTMHIAAARIEAMNGRLHRGELVMIKSRRLSNKWLTEGA